MRVLHLATTYPLFEEDSNASFIASLAQALADRGHQIDVLIPWHPRLQLDRPSDSVRLHAFKYSPLQSWHPWGCAQALQSDRRLRWSAYLAAPAASWLAWRGLRALLGGQRFDLLHAHWLLPNGPIAAALPHRLRPPLVISCHGSGVFLAERHRWAHRLASYAQRRAAAITACSGELAQRAEQLGAGPAVQRISYGVDTARFLPLSEASRRQHRQQLAQQHGIPDDGPWILAVGRLVSKKGFHGLPEALRIIRESIPNARVLIVGAGPLGPELESQAMRQGVGEALHLLGAIPHVELPAYYAVADLVTVPSVHSPEGNVDGLPNTLLEALASGAAVVASRVAGIPELVDHGNNGILFPEADWKRLAAAVVALLRDPRRQDAVRAAARSLAEGDLEWDRVAERFVRVYERALQQ